MSALAPQKVSEFDKNSHNEQKVGEIQDEFNSLHTSMDSIINDIIINRINELECNLSTQNNKIERQNRRIEEQNSRIEELNSRIEELILSQQNDDLQNNSINHETGSNLTKKQVIRYWTEDNNFRRLPDLGLNDNSEKHIGYWISSGGEASGRAIYKRLTGGYIYFNSEKNPIPIKDKSSNNIKLFSV